MKRLLLLFLAVCLLTLWGCDAENSRKGEFLFSESRTPEELAVLAEKTVILDAGHGFEDPGCEYPENGIVERELTLLLAQKIASALEAHGVTVLFTHDGESFCGREALDEMAARQGYDLGAYLNALVEAYSGREGEQIGATVEAFGEGVNKDGVYDTFERAYYANLLEADLFLSVHINASGTNSRARGSDLFVCSDSPHHEASASLMAALDASLKHSFPARRIDTREDSWDNAFVVTKYLDMPSLLLEAGFASNREDATELTDSAWQNSFADAVAEGIEMYLLGF